MRRPTRIQKKFFVVQWDAVAAGKAATNILSKQPLSNSHSVDIYGKKCYNFAQSMKIVLQGFSSGKPADYFTKKQAQEAVNAADQIIRFFESILFG